MRIRIISDLHIDINSRHPFSYPDTDDTFTIICGDTSGDASTTAKWIERNIRQGVFVIGNHYGYNQTGKPLQKVQQYLKRKFPLKSSVSYLNNSIKIIGDAVFFGATLWTDFRLGASIPEEV